MSHPNVRGDAAEVVHRPAAAEAHAAAPPPGVAGPLYDALHAAWRAARRARSAECRDTLQAALCTFARDARARGVPVSALLVGLDALAHPTRGSDPALDFSDVRAWAGTVVIRAYYRDD